VPAVGRRVGNRVEELLSRAAEMAQKLFGLAVSVVCQHDADEQRPRPHVQGLLVRSALSGGLGRPHECTTDRGRQVAVPGLVHHHHRVPPERCIDTTPGPRARQRAGRYGCAIEIERKFVVAEPPGDLDRRPSTAIEQGYLAIADDGTEVRVRRRAGAATLTVKSGSSRTRVEEELEIEPERFERLWPLTEGRRIEKTRYEIDADGGLTIELDVYAGALEGLVVAEVEFASEDDADAFSPPSWMEREVTDDARYKNQRLACDGLPPP
jgi:adenylate cyclase